MIADVCVDYHKTSASFQGQDTIIPLNGCLVCPDLGRKEDEPEGRASKVLKYSLRTWIQACSLLDSLYDPAEVTLTF